MKILENKTIRKIFAVISGFAFASFVMMLFEFTNSKIYPFPEGMNTMDLEEVQVFARTLPYTAYILVFLGWVFGSLVAGYVATKISKEEMYFSVKDRIFSSAFIVGIFLTLAGIFNNIAFAAPLFFTILTLPIFIIFTHLGYNYYVKK